MLPKKGKVFPVGNDRENGETSYAATIAAALRAELGNTHQAAKTLMRWTGAGERTVKHWLAGTHGPCGAYLLVLMWESEAVVEAVLDAAGRRDAVVATRVLAAHDMMAKVMAMIEPAQPGPEDGRLWDADGHGRLVGTEADDRVNDRVNVRVNDRVNPTPGDRLNPRQRWYLEVLASGSDVRAIDLQHRWNVSEMTARRDLADLKARGLIEFVGAFRTGRYRLIR